MISLTHNIEKVLQSIERFEKTIVPTASSVLIEQIKTLRSKGQDADGGVSVPYTPAYIPVRQRKGRQTSYVDHYVTGGFLKSISYRDGAVRPGEQYEKIAEGLSKKRTDFGVHPQTPEKVEIALAKAWDAAT
ncbi:MAG: hypothetical protein KGH93_03320 [Patescibacteria group bacterium]|nr:hypothetical protein [Patescibacteria group bacterium]